MKKENPIFIFDFDGTLANTFDIFCDLFNEIAHQYNYTSITPENKIIIKESGLYELFKLSRIPLLKVPFVVNSLRKNLNTHIQQVKPFHGIYEVLYLMKEHNCTLGIITSNSPNNVYDFLHRNNLMIFDFIYGRSTLFGKYSLIDYCITKKNLNRSSITYIGDEIRDIQAARKSNVHSAAVSWGFNTKKILQQHKPDFLFNDPIELSLLIGNQ